MHISSKKRIWTAVASAIVAGNLLTASIASAATDVDAPGSVQICKAASEGVSGTFAFNVTSVRGVVSVEAGKCSDPIPVVARTARVFERPSPGTTVARITAEPADRLVSADLRTRQALVSTQPDSTPTIVTFTNAVSQAPTGTLEICKRAGHPDVTGAFTFLVRGVREPVTVEVGKCSDPIQVPAGRVIVAERPQAGTVVRLIAAVPPERLLDAQPKLRTATVLVPERGGPTKVFFINGLSRP